MPPGFSSPRVYEKAASRTLVLRRPSQLRLIDWLRHDKPRELKIGKTSKQRIRQTLERVDELGQHLVERGFEVWVDHRGNLVFEGLEGLLHIPLGKGIAHTSPIPRSTSFARSRRTA